MALSTAALLMPRRRSASINSMRPTLSSLGDPVGTPLLRSANLPRAARAPTHVHAGSGLGNRSVIKRLPTKGLVLKSQLKTRKTQPGPSTRVDSAAAAARSAERRMAPAIGSSQPLTTEERLSFALAAGHLGSWDLDLGTHELFATDIYK